MALLSWLFGKKRQQEPQDEANPARKPSFTVTIGDHTETIEIDLSPEQAAALAKAEEYRENHKPDLPALPTGPFRFIALDVETANEDPASICQIGLAFVRPDNSITTWSTYVDPDDDFSTSNTNIHGITEDKIIETEAPFFEYALAHIAPALTANTVFQHSDFDRRCMVEACEATGATMPTMKWADSVRVAQRAWPELRGNGGHGLANLKVYLGLNFRHHDAGEDAKAAADVVLRAEEKTGEDFAALVKPPTKKRSFAPAVTKDGDPLGRLAGQIAVFTGSLSMSREAAAAIAAANGITIAANVTKKTTILIVGDQDMSVLAGHTKSSKHRKAEEYIANGQPIRIVGETEFHEMLKKA